MITKSIVYDHRNRATKEGPVEIRVTIERKSYYINTGVKIKKSQFRNGMIINRPDMYELNERIAILSRRIDKLINKTIGEERAIDVAELRRLAYEPSAEKTPTDMYDWFATQVPLLNIGEGTRRRYTTLLNRLREYGKLMSWSDLTAENIYLFDAWLHGIKKSQTNADHQSGKEPEKIGNAAVYNYHRTLRSLLTRAIKFNIIQANPYDRMKGEFRKGIKENVEYLTEEEIAAFESIHPVEGSQIAAARDLFIFQLYTGLSYSDAQAFDMSNYKLIDGTWRHTGERIKTGVPYVNQLLPPVVEVLQRYGWKAPKILNSDYNKCLKMLGMAAGINTRLHSHLARHTFATRMLRWGVKIENVSKMLGHTNITQTQRYAKVVAESVHEDFARIAEQLTKKGTPK